MSLGINGSHAFLVDLFCSTQIAYYPRQKWWGFLLLAVKVDGVYIDKQIVL